MRELKDFIHFKQSGIVCFKTSRLSAPIIISDKQQKQPIYVTTGTPKISITQPSINITKQLKNVKSNTEEQNSSINKAFIGTAGASGIIASLAVLFE